MECPNIPACINCDPTNPSTCTSCNTGYYLMNGTCMPCAAYCYLCTSATLCQVPVNPYGFALMMNVDETSNYLVACDPGCIICSNSNPSMCTTCMNGYYLTTNNYCKACTISSYCAVCSTTNASSCITCFTGYFLNNNVCVQCTFPCTSCTNQVATQCSSCAIGYTLLSNNTCTKTSTLSSSFGTITENCANSQLSTVGTSSILKCNLCKQGYSLTSSGCVPCVEGCQTCNPNSLTKCSQCLPGYILNTTNLCSPCNFTHCVFCLPF